MVFRKIGLVVLILSLVACGGEETTYELYKAPGSDGDNGGDSGPQNAAPTLAIISTNSINGEVTIRTQANDTDQDPLSFVWTINGEVAYDITSSTFTKVLDDGAYQIGVTVSDGTNSVTRQTNVMVARPAADNVAPVPLFSIMDAGDRRQKMLDATASYDANGDPLSYIWSINGEPVNGQFGVQNLYTFTGPGTYTVGLTVYDGQLLSETLQKSVTIANSEPSVSFTTSSDGLSTNFYGQVSDADGDVVNVTWFINNQRASSDLSFQYTFPQSGSYRIELVAIDAFNGESRVINEAFQVSENVPVNQNPVATFNYQVNAQSVNFDASGTTDSDGDSLSYAWNFGDGASASGVTANHQYNNANGQYTVVLTVSDGTNTVSTSRFVRIEETQVNTAPVADFSYDISDATVVFTNSSRDDDNDTLTYSWTFGDGTSSSSRSPSHTYSATGQYNVTLTVSDGTESVSRSQNVSVTVPVNQDPAASFTYQVNGQMVSFDASGTTDPDGDSLSYSWNFDDGASASGVTANHQYANANSEYMVVLTVSDGTNTVSTSRTVRIEASNSNTAPVAGFTYVANGATIAFSNTSRDDDKDTLTYSWTFGDGAGSSDTSPSHTYSASGQYSVTLTVNDGTDSVSSSQTVSVTVPDDNSGGGDNGGGDDDFFIGDPLRGKTLYESVSQNCVGCHGEQGIEGAIVPVDITPYHYGSKDLYSYITDFMPNIDPTLCVGQCAADIEAYMLTWSLPTAELPPEACGDRITYSARQLKLLTKAEYQNTVEDLVGIDFNATTSIPSDASIHGFSNNMAASVTQVHENAYFNAAKEIAAASRARNFAGVVSCNLTSAQACLDDFVAGFAKRAFRRPLTKNEIATFASMFQESLTDNNVAVGVELAMRLALSSPAFLYRSEQGVPVSSGEHDGSQYEFSGQTTSLVADDFTDKRHYIAGTESGALIVGDTSNGRQQGKLGRHLTYTGAGTRIEFSLRAVLPESGEVPVVKYSVSGINGSFPVDWEEFRTLSLYFPGLSGTHEFAFYIDAGPARVEFYQFRVGEATLINNAPDLDAYVLTPYEVATYLAYTFTGSTPDSILMAAADAGELATDEQIAQQVNRLLGTERAKKQLGDFAAQWMGTDLALTQPKDMTKFPALNDAIRESMAQEVRELFVYATLGDAGSFKEFFTTNSAFVDATLATYYNLSSPGTSGFGKVDGGTQRGGILTTGAFHVAYGNFEETSPIVRAARVRERLLCQDVPPPPAGIAVDRAAAEEEIADIIAAEGGVTQRHRTELLTQAPYCATCHEKIINPLGFGMEDFDTIGRFQTRDINNQAINAEGILHGLEGLADIDSTQQGFYGSKELAGVIAETESAYSCFTQKMFRFATGYGVDIIDSHNADLGELTAQEKADNSCSVAGMTENMVNSGYDAKAALRSLSTLKLIRYRKEMGR